MLLHHAWTLFRYSPGSHLSGTRRDFYFSSTRPDSTLLWYSPGFHLSLVLAQISTFPALTGSYLSGTRPDFYFSSTRSDSTLSRYSPIPFFGTRPDSTFLWYLPRFPPFRHSPGFYLFWYSPGFLLFQHSLGFYHFLVLTRTLLRYSPRFHLSDTSRDSTFSCTHPNPTFSGACPDPSPDLAWISSSSPASPPNFIIFSGIVLVSLIFPGIVPGFL